MSISFALRTSRYLLPLLLAVVVLLPLAPMAGSSNSSKVKSCTIFTAVLGDQIYFCGNEDFHNTDLIVWFVPNTGTDYGSLRLGYREGQGQQLSVAMNDQGLAWDANSIPKTTLNPHPEKPYSGWSDFLSYITRKVRTVEEVIQLAEEYDFSGTPLEFMQLQVADATGDAVVIGPGEDGELYYSRKTPGDGYLISTNFNLAIPDMGNHPETYLRYDNAAAMLEQLGVSKDISPGYMGSILESNHFEFVSTYTLFSFVFDTKNRIAYVYYMSDYDEVIELDLTRELAGNNRIVSMSELVSDSTRERALSRYRSTMAGDIVLIVVFVLSLIILVISLVKGIRYYLRLRRTGQAPGMWLVDPRYVFAAGLAWMCCFWAVALFMSHIYPPGIIEAIRPAELFASSLKLAIAGSPGIIIAVAGITLIIRERNIAETGKQRKIGIPVMIISSIQVGASVYLAVGLVKLFTLL